MCVCECLYLYLCVYNCSASCGCCTLHAVASFCHEPSPKREIQSELVGLARRQQAEWDSEREEEGDRDREHLHSPYAPPLSVCALSHCLHCTSASTRCVNGIKNLTNLYNFFFYILSFFPPFFCFVACLLYSLRFSCQYIGGVATLQQKGSTTTLSFDVRSPLS